MTLMVKNLDAPLGAEIGGIDIIFPCCTGVIRSIPRRGASCTAVRSRAMNGSIELQQLHTAKRDGEGRTNEAARDRVALRAAAPSSALRAVIPHLQRV